MLIRNDKNTGGRTNMLWRVTGLVIGGAVAYQIVNKSKGAYARVECPHCGSNVGVFFPLEGMEIYCDSCNQPMVIDRKSGHWEAEEVS
jgi:ribosomal protein S27E